MHAVRSFAILAVFSLGLFVGCSKNPTIAIPPPPPLTFYTADFATNQIITYSQPLSGTSMPALTLNAASLGVGSPNGINGIGADNFNNFSLVDTTTFKIYIFHAPLSASSNVSQATAIGPPAGVGFIRRFGFDSSNDLWAPDSLLNSIYMWAPGNTSTTPTFTITSSTPAMSDPLAPVFDNAGHMFVANFSINALYVFAFPMSTSTPNVAANIATCAAPVDVGIDARHFVYVSCNVSGQVQVFGPPWGTGNTPQFVINPPAGVTEAQALRFDSSGNLYVSYLAPLETAVYAPPLSASSVPLFVIPTGEVTSMAFAH